MHYIRMIITHSNKVTLSISFNMQLPKIACDVLYRIDSYFLLQKDPKTNNKQDFISTLLNSFLRNIWRYLGRQESLRSLYTTCEAGHVT